MAPWKTPPVAPEVVEQVQDVDATEVDQDTTKKVRW
jgi:hypothetical protein